MYNSELLTNNPDGLTLKQAQAVYSRGDGASPGPVIKVYDISEEANEAVALWYTIAPNVLETVYPSAATYTSDEAAEISMLTPNINAYREEMFVKFIMGTADWKPNGTAMWNTSRPWAWSAPWKSGRRPWTATTSAKIRSDTLPRREGLPSRRAAQEVEQCKPANHPMRIARELRRNRYVYLMALPVIAYYLLFCYGPMYGAQIAFRNFHGLQGHRGQRMGGHEVVCELHPGAVFFARDGQHAPHQPISADLRLSRAHFAGVASQ